MPGACLQQSERFAKQRYFGLIAATDHILGPLDHAAAPALGSSGFAGESSTGAGTALSWVYGRCGG
jgi:hypothetical protein